MPSGEYLPPVGLSVSGSRSESVAGLSQRDRLALAADRLSERDQRIVTALAKLRFASTGQLARLLFDDIAGPRTRIRQTQRSIEQLANQGLLHRLARQMGGARAGSSGYVCTLTREGLRVAAYLRGEGIPKTAGRVLEPGSRFVDHALATGEVFTGLVEADRAGDVELLEHQAEPDCWRQAQGRAGLLHLRPDGFYALGKGDLELRWFFEADLGTEGSRTLRRKLVTYLDYRRTGQEQIEHGVFPRVLWACKQPRRVQLLARLVDELPPQDQQLFAICQLDQAALAMISGAKTELQSETGDQLI